MNHFIFVADRNWSEAMGDLDSLHIPESDLIKLVRTPLLR